MSHLPANMQQGSGDQATNFFAVCGHASGTELQIDDDSGRYSPEALHESWKQAITDIEVSVYRSGTHRPVSVVCRNEA